MQPSTELKYLDIIHLKTKLLLLLSQKITSNNDKHKLEKESLHEICLKIYNVSCSVVELCQYIALKSPCSINDKLKLKSRSSRMVIKQIINQVENPETCPLKQMDNLMNLSILLSSHISIIYQEYINRKIILCKEKKNSYEESYHFNRIIKPPNTFDENIKIILPKMKEFMKLLSNLSNELTIFEEKRINLSKINLIVSLCKDDYKQLENYNLYQNTIRVLIEKIDSLCKFSKDISCAIGTFFEKIYTNTQEKSNALYLVNNLRIVISHILCILRSNLLYDCNPCVTSIHHYSNTDSINDIPDGLKHCTLYQIGNINTQTSIIDYCLLELTNKLQRINEELDLIKTFTNLKKNRLHQLKEYEQRILEYQVSKHKREEIWEENENQYISDISKGINDYREFIKLQKELNYSDMDEYGNENIIEKININNKPNNQKKRGKLPNTIKFSKFNFSPRKKELKFSQPLEDSLTPSKNRTIRSVTLNLDSINYNKQEIENYDITNSDDITTTTDEFIPFDELYDTELENKIRKKRIAIGNDILIKLEKQLDYRVKLNTRIFGKSKTSSTKLISELTILIKQKQSETLKELGDLHISERTLITQIEKIKEEIDSYNIVKSNKDKETNKNSKLELLEYESISIAFNRAIKAYNCQFKLLFEKINNIKPQFESYNINIRNIWKEPHVRSGINKTVIYSTDPNRKGHIIAGTLNQLVIKSTDEKQHDLNFLKTFITTFQSFTTPEILFQKLIERYNVPHDTDIPESQWKQDIVLPIQVRVSNFIKKWLEMKFYHFNYKLMKKLNIFIDEKLCNDGHAKFARGLNSLIKRKIYSEYKPLNINTQVKVFPEKLISNFLVDTPAISIAQQITKLDSEYYRSIQPEELLYHLSSKSKSRCTNITKLIDRFNIFSSWIAFLIVRQNDSELRTNIIIKFMEIGIEFKNLNNFHGLLSLIGGVRNSSVYRLKDSFVNIPNSISNKFDELCTLMKASNSYKTYRGIIHNIAPPLVPYIGVYLQDLTFINDGNPNTIDGLINFRKRELMYRVIEEFHGYQQKPYDIQIDEQIFNFISGMKRFSDDELFELSKKIKK